MSKSNSKSEVIKLGAENPAEVALVIDVSGSMRGDKLMHTQVASIRLIKLLRVNKDSLGICSFNSGGKMEWADDKKVKFLKDVAAQGSAIKSVRELTAGGTTDMLQGLTMASNMFTTGVSNKAAILLSDGRDHHTAKEKELARQLNENNKEVYTIAIGADADRPLLKELAGADARYNEVPDAFDANTVFTKIIGQLGVAHVLLNKIKEIKADKFTGKIYPEAQADNSVPSKKTEIVIAVAWDKLDVTCQGVNDMVLLEDKQISFTIGKVSSGSLVKPKASDLNTLHEEKGLLIVKVSNVSAGDAYGVEMEKYYDSKETIRFSVGVFA